ncbi:hypothetical protein QBZ16_000355 [Prototheca wickerhamii]|uniref:U3 small nucleolar RNA-associated protein 6 N-terminal domain-containing protein n=1 Tax=Prototheca wickerhamii TaxID=3111 RepID=A0AAD9IPU3_PROWI|nr:hypothetical protein QBZ16_000355 [Prototheca wickerhamii]
MADTVRYLLERMVPELQDLERRGYFSKAELAEVVRRRQDYEYALKRTAARLPDFLRAIEYESQLERLRLARRRARHLRGKSTLADRCLVQRVHFIYRRATRKFRGDLALWGDWVRFCHATRSTKLGARVIRRALALHPRCAALTPTWPPRALMQQGIRACAAARPAAETLWVEYFRLELLAAARLRARREVLGIKDDAAVHIALIAFRAALREVEAPSVAFLSRFLDVIRELGPFEGTQEIEDAVYAAIADSADREPRAWALLALRAAGAGDADGLREAGAARAEAAGVLAGFADAAADFWLRLADRSAEAPALQDYALQQAEALAERVVAKGAASEELLETRVALSLRRADLAAASEQAKAAGAEAGALIALSVRCTAALAAAGRVAEPVATPADSSDDDDVNDGASAHAAAPLDPTVLAALERAPRCVATWLAAIQYAASNLHDLSPLCRLLPQAVLAGKSGPVEGGLGLVAAALLRAVVASGGLTQARDLYRTLTRGPSPGGAFWHAVLDLEVDLVPAAFPKDALAPAQVKALFEGAVDAHGQGGPRALAAATSGLGQVYWKAIKALRDPAPFVEACQREKLA